MKNDLLYIKCLFDGEEIIYRVDYPTKEVSFWEKSHNKWIASRCDEDINGDIRYDQHPVIDFIEDSEETIDDVYFTYISKSDLFLEFI